MSLKNIYKCSINGELLTKEVLERKNFEKELVNLMKQYKDKKVEKSENMNIKEEEQESEK